MPSSLAIVNILVTATGQVDDDAFADTESRRKLLCVSDGVRRLQRRNDAFRARQLMECGKRLIIGRRHVLHAAAVLQPRVRSEEHTSELQSLMRISYAVFCLKKKKTIDNHYSYDTR